MSQLCRSRREIKMNNSGADPAGRKIVCELRLIGTNVALRCESCLVGVAVPSENPVLANEDNPSFCSTHMQKGVVSMFQGRSF